MRRITVTNMMGQTLIDQELEGNEARLNMSHLAAGTYLIRIHTDNGMAIKRVNLIR